MPRVTGRSKKRSFVALAATVSAAVAAFAFAGPVPPSPAPPPDRIVTGELVRVHLPRRAFMLKVGSPARELEIKVDEASTLFSGGRLVALRDLRPGHLATVACTARGGAQYARTARFSAARR